MIENRYWLSRLADAAEDRSSSIPGSLPATDYFPIPSERLPHQKEHGYSKTRKYDASLRPSAAEASTVFKVLLNIEYTKADPPNLKCNPLVGATDHVAKYQQAITNADDVLTLQSTRLFVPTLSFHGKKENTTLLVSILSPERLELAVVPHCFSSAGFPTVSVLLHLFRAASLYELGYNPLVAYSLTTSPPGFSVGDIVPAAVFVPGAQKVRLSGKRLSQLRSSPFERSTVVLEGELGEQSSDGKEPTPVVVKMAFISEDRLWREKIVVNALYAANPHVDPPYAPKLLAAFAARASPPPSPPNVHLGWPMVPRHLLFRSRHGARQLRLEDVPSVVEFLAAAEQLFQAILDAFRRRILHRDISVNNVLVADNQLLLIDWDIGQHFPEPASGQHLTGTLDTMSVASLANKGDPLPHDDVESAVYVILKVLMQTLVPPVDRQREWAAMLKRFHWDDARVDPRELCDLRICLWKLLDYEDSAINTTLQFFQSTGHAGRAQLTRSLLSLPLPAQRRSLDTSNYDAVLASLEPLVEQAVAAVRAVDVGGFLVPILEQASA